MPGFHVVKSEDQLNGLWRTPGDQKFPQGHDSSASMLLVAIAGEPDIMQTRIHKVLETGSALHVYVRETRRGAQCANHPDHTPSDAVSVTRIEKPVRFYVEEESAESCGELPAVAVKCRAGEAPPGGYHGPASRFQYRCRCRSNSGNCGNTAQLEKETNSN